MLSLLVVWQNKQTPGACVHLLGLSYPTVRRWYSKFCEHLPDTEEKLTGASEADESFFGRRKSGNQTLMAGLRARSGEIRPSQIQDRGSFSLTGFLVRTLTERSLLLTDMHAGYADAEAFYLRMPCNHS